MTFRQPDFAALEKQTFLETFKYRLIYVYSIDDKKHEGYLKVGDTDVVSSLTPDQLTPNCKVLCGLWGPHSHARRLPLTAPSRSRLRRAPTRPRSSAPQVLFRCRVRSCPAPRP